MSKLKKVKCLDCNNVQTSVNFVTTSSTCKKCGSRNIWALDIAKDIDKLSKADCGISEEDAKKMKIRWR